MNTDSQDPEHKVFEAFNHFIIVKTNHEFCLSHFQIVQNVITSAVIHTKSGKGFTEQNQGQLEFLKIAETHVCNEFCTSLNLPPIDVEKIKEVPLPNAPVFKTTNGIPIRRTVAAAATEKLVTATGGQAGFVSQKRAVFLQNADLYPPNPAAAAIAATASVPVIPKSPSPTPYQSSTLGDSGSLVPPSPPSSPIPGAAPSTSALPVALAPTPASTPADTLTSTTASVPTTAPASSTTSVAPPSTVIASPTTTPAATPPTPRKLFGSAVVPKNPQLSPQLTPHSKPTPDLKPILEPKAKPDPKSLPKLDLKTEPPKSEPKLDLKSEQVQSKPAEPKTEQLQPKSGDSKSEPAKQETKTDKKPSSVAFSAPKPVDSSAKPTAQKEGSRDNLTTPRDQSVTPRGEKDQTTTPRDQPTPATQTYAPAQTPSAHDPQTAFKQPSAPAGLDLQKVYLTLLKVSL